jgi:glycosyltransferase involved in cell wall biosynthesis
VMGSLYSHAVEDVITDGLNGWTFRPDDPSSLRSAMERALNASAGEIDCMGSQARNRVRDLTAQSMSRQMIAAIEYAHNS